MNRITEKIPIKAVTIPNFVPRPSQPIAPSGFSDFFLYAGSLENHKGILNLVEIFTDASVDARLVIAGRGSLSNTIRETVRKHGLESKIILLGWIDEEVLFRLLNDATALLTPSIWPENSPLIVLEALSVGTPVIASNNGGIPEIIEKVDKRLVFYDWKMLKELLINFSKNDYDPQKIRRVYEQNFSPEAYFQEYFKIIRNV